jgi:ribosomal protein S18 acetylase RimI-like enzyme
MIRKIDKKEIELLLKIKEEFNKEYKIQKKSKTFILKEFKDYLEKGNIFIEEIKNKIVGYLIGTIEKNNYENFGYIEEIFISKDFRKKGISTKLKNEFIKVLKSKKIKLCRIEVSPKNKAKKVYKKWGFKIEKYRMGLKI